MTLYAPAKEDFLPSTSVIANAKVQTWDQYWGWVQAFYAGNLLADGWTKHGEQSLAVIKSGENRQDLIDRYNELGKIVGRQWAKDYAVRKITTADLRRWHEAVAAAVRSDDGSGDKIKKVARQGSRTSGKATCHTSPRGLGASGLHGQASVPKRPSASCPAGQEAIDRVNRDRMIARPGFGINRFGPLSPIRRCD